jgi:hypothetical protein
MTASPATASLRNRRYKRVAEPEKLQITWQCAGVREITGGNNLNQGGVFLVTQKVQPVGTTLKLKIANPGADIPVAGVVRSSVADKGMGVEFVAIGNKERAKLDLLVKRLLLAEAEQEKLEKDEPAAQPARGTVGGYASDWAKGRRFPRINLPRGLKVAWTLGQEREVATAGTVGLGGLFIVSSHPAPVGSTLRLLFEIPGGEVLATVTVRNVAPGRGMGVEFTQIRPEDRARLDQLLRRLLS